MTSTADPSVTGIVLAAGSGTRMGRPKALVTTPDGEPWVARAVRLLLEAGCGEVVVVLGAAASEASTLVPTDAAVRTITNEDWPRGMGTSLAAALAAATGDAALVTVVDTPDLPLAIVRRVLRAAYGRGSLARAVFDGRPGHPALIGRDHWPAVSTTLTGDHGARAYLDAHAAVEVECGDLYDGHDVDVASP
jgi:CTP:molybdopterin cytidylyltransferase MocA